MVTLTIVVIPFTKSKRGIAIKIRVEPRSSRKGLSGVIGDTLKIKVHAPPVGGAANEELDRDTFRGVRHKKIRHKDYQRSILKR